MNIMIHSQYFTVSDWLKALGEFFINKVAWELDYQTTSFTGAAARLFTHDWTKKNGVHGHPKTKLLDFWLKRNGRNARIRKAYCSMDVIYFFRSICKKKLVFISWNCAEKLAKVLKKVYEEVSLLRTWKYLELITKHLLNSAFVWCEELCMNYATRSA